MLPAISSAISGMQAASLRLVASARSIANANTAPVEETTAQAAPTSVTGAVRNVSPAWMAAHAPQSPDLTNAVVELVTARNGFLANTKTLEVTQAMMKRLFGLTD